MGTAKRERQKAGRQSRREEAAVEAKKQQKRKQYRYYGSFVALALVIVAFFTIRGLLRDDSSSTTTTTTGATGASAATGAVTTTTAVAKYGTVACPPTDGSAQRQIAYDAASGGFQQCIDPAKTYSATIKMKVGDTSYDVAVDLDAKKAPITVNNFVSLARAKFYDATPCHRVIPNFVAQCGDPQGTGSGGPGYKFADELPAAGEYKVGSLAMANSGPNTNGSQFFIITGSDGAALPPNYTLFGKLRDGQDATIKALDAAGNPDKSKNGVPPITAVGITSVTVTEG